MASAGGSAGRASEAGTAVVGAPSAVLGATGAVRLNAKRPPALPPPVAACWALTTSSSCSKPLITCRSDHTSVLGAVSTQVWRATHEFCLALIIEWQERYRIVQGFPQLCDILNERTEFALIRGGLCLLQSFTKRYRPDKISNRERERRLQTVVVRLELRVETRCKRCVGHDDLRARFSFNLGGCPGLWQTACTCCRAYKQYIAEAYAVLLGLVSPLQDLRTPLRQNAGC